MATLPPPPRVEPSETPSRIWEQGGAISADLSVGERSGVMDQPSGGLDDVQDVSPADVPPVVDLTRKGEERSLGPAALDALVRSSSWFPNTSDLGPRFSDSSSAGDPNLPGDAFSHTTVTLSYMSRSHVFSRSDSMSQHSPLYSTPPLSKLSLHSRQGSEGHSGIPEYSQEQAEESKYLGALPEAGQACRAGGRVAQRYIQVNGDRFVTKAALDVERHCRLPGDSRTLDNGAPGSSSLSEGQSPPETRTSVTAEKDEDGGSEAPLLPAKQNCVVASGTPHYQDRCRDYRSPLEDPVSPSSTSLDGVEEVFVLPQASRSPSADKSHPETANGGACDAWSAGISAGGLDWRGKDPPAHSQEPDLTVRNPGPDVSENVQDPAGPHVTDKTVGLREPPAGTGVQWTTSRNSDLSGSTLSPSHSASHDSALSRPGPPIPERESTSGPTQTKSVASTSDLQTKAREPAPPLRPRAARCRRNPPPQSGLEATADWSAPGAPRRPSQSGVSAGVPVSSPPPKNKSREPPSAGKKTGARTPKRRRRKPKAGGPPSMFSPQEPQIKLRYASFKEERKESRPNLFSPFIRVERTQPPPPLCSVVNYPEEVQAQQSGRRSFVSAAVPSTSCLHMGRPFNHSQHRRALVCCLCGQPANAMDLGDLHGPYYPGGLRPSTKTSASTPALREEEEGLGGAASSSFSRRKSVAPHTAWSVRNQLKQNMESRRRVGGASSSPAAKRARLVAGSTESQDWFSPPILPLEPCEYWLHEDCSVWSAGVFLVKGRVYGLEEATRAARQTTCSWCQRPGATLGCVFKGCANKYHYRCALDSESALIEENFSMKCKKHKNKTFKAPRGGGR